MVRWKEGEAGEILADALQSYWVCFHEKHGAVLYFFIVPSCVSETLTCLAVPRNSAPVAAARAPQICDAILSWPARSYQEEPDEDGLPAEFPKDGRRDTFRITCNRFHVNIFH